MHLTAYQSVIIITRSKKHSVSQSPPPGSPPNSSSLMGVVGLLSVTATVAAIGIDGIAVTAATGRVVSVVGDYTHTYLKSFWHRNIWN